MFQYGISASIFVVFSFWDVSLNSGKKQVV